jgi:hypothetical protein
MAEVRFAKGERVPSWLFDVEPARGGAPRPRLYSDSDCRLVEGEDAFSVVAVYAGERAAFGLRIDAADIIASGSPKGLEDYRLVAVTKAVHFPDVGLVVQVEGTPWRGQCSTMRRQRAARVTGFVFRARRYQAAGRRIDSLRAS